MMTWCRVRPAVFAALALMLGGCIWPFEPPPLRTVRYDGAVTRADGSPVPGVQVEITDGIEVVRPGSGPPPPPGAGPCSGTIDGDVERAVTDSRGQFLVQVRRPPPGGGFCLRLRATPPAGSGLAEAVVQDFVSRFNQPDTNQELLHRRIDVVLKPTP